MGVVLRRNAQGRFVANQAYTCHDAALLIKNLELTKVIVETDC